MAESVNNLQNEFKLKINEQFQAAQERQQKSFDEMLKQLEMIGAEDSSLGDGIAAFITIPDEILQKIETIFLEQIEKSFSAPARLTLIIQQMNLKGQTIEDLFEDFDKLVEKIDKETIGILSPFKKEFFKKIVYIIKNKLSEVEGIAKKTISIPTELCLEGAKLPEYAHPADAGMDVYAAEDYDINPGETVLISTGIKMAIPKGYAILIQPRSGLSLKTKLRIPNSIGLIDSGYKDQIKVIVENTDSPIRDITYDFDEKGTPIISSILHGASIHIEKGERIAQMRLVEVPHAACIQVDSINSIGEDRGGGFGSTGIKEFKERTNIEDDLDLAEAAAAMIKLQDNSEKNANDENVKD